MNRRQKSTIRNFIFVILATTAFVIAMTNIKDAINKSEAIRIMKLLVASGWKILCGVCCAVASFRRIIDVYRTEANRGNRGHDSLFPLFSPVQ